MTSVLDAVVVGAGPNGLTAAVELARRGMSVEVFEARETVGGGARTAELTLPGFRHDTCSAVHPMAIGSPAFAAMPLARHGLTWLHADIAMAQPLADGTAAVLTGSVGETAMSLGPRDAGTYRRLVAPFVGHWDTLAADFLRTQWLGLPRDPVRYARFGLVAGLPVDVLGRRFRDDRARALLAGMAGHLIAPTGAIGTAGAALMFALAAHHGGWPMPRGGSQALSDALTSLLREHGGEVHTGFEVKRLDDLPPARAYLFDTSPTAMARIAGLGDAYTGTRYGPGVFKIDYALDGPVPWTAEPVRRAGTVHVGASSGEIRTALRQVAVDGTPPDRPLLIAAQPSLVDDTRAPAGKHTFWVYGHVPNGWRGDLTDAVERQLERFAPGFRDLVLARATAGPPEFAAANANYVGGDIYAGSAVGLRMLVRPKLTRNPYRTAHPAVFLCSQSAPPGPGVHGMSGHHAARQVWRSLRTDR
ncbi:phytoene desaturase family protein [Streptomyces sp. NPDC059740]|uniref:phytoene desaturase family protein n=1 Tax=Streptomyces sp. NPDC059740 TaxID=3346926 RepID=UPI003663249E